METVAEIVADAILTLNTPTEYFHPRDAMSIVRRRLAYYTTQQAQGDQKTQMVCKEVNYIDEEILLADVTSPDWVERRVANSNFYNDVSDVWEYIPTVNIDSLAEWKAENRPAVAFYFDTGGGLRMRISDMWGQNSNINYRVWHHPTVDPVTNLTDSVNLPPNFAYMLAAEVKKEGVNIILNRCAQISDDNPPSTLQIAAWKGLQESAEREVMEWQQLFEEYRNRSFGGRKGRNRRKILRGSSYGYGYGVNR